MKEIDLNFHLKNAYFSNQITIEICSDNEE